MLLQAKTSTDDGRLTKGKVYHGEIVQTSLKAYSNDTGLRFVCFDDCGEWMTFNLKVFIPVGGEVR